MILRCAHASLVSWSFARLVLCNILYDTIKGHLVTRLVERRCRVPLSGSRHREELVFGLFYLLSLDFLSLFNDLYVDPVNYCIARLLLH